MATARATSGTLETSAPAAATRLAALALLGACLTACAFTRYAPAALDPSVMPATLAAGTLTAPPHRTLLEHLDAAPVWPPTHWSPTQLGLVAVARSPLLVAARAEVVAAQARRLLALQRQNPEVSLALERHSSEEDGSDSLWSVGPTIEMVLGPPGQRRLVGDRAAIDVAMARLDVQDAAWQARDRALYAALELSAQREQNALAEQAARVRRQVVAAARALVAAGVADAFEWQTMMLDESAARLVRLGHVSALAAAESDLLAALGLPGTSPDVLALAPPAAAALPGYATLQAQALTRHPRVLRALGAYERAEHDLALAVSAQYPSLRLNPGYFFDQGDHVWSLIGGVVVPLFASHDVPIASAAAARDAAREQFHVAQADTVAELQRTHAVWQAALAVQREVEDIAADIERQHTDLVDRRGEGIGDDLGVARAALQVAEVAVQRARCAADVRLTRARLESAARFTDADPPFARYLAELAELAVDADANVGSRLP